MSYVQTPAAGRFGGLILPEDHVRTMIAQEARSIYGNRGGYGGAYDAVRGDNKNVIGRPVTIGSADTDTLPDIDPLRWRARDLDRNNPMAAGGLDTIVDNVVSTGLRPQSSIDREILGLSEDEAARWQRDAERYFYLWADSPFSDVGCYGTYWEHQGLVLLNTLLSGDVFTVRRYKPRPGALFGTCLQLVEADRCQTPAEKQNAVDSNVHGGVECDADGEPVRYHFLKRHPGDYLTNAGTQPNEYTTVPAFDGNGERLCLHHFVRRRPDQRRGVSVLAPVIEMFLQTGRFTEAKIASAVVASMFSVFIKSQSPQSAILPGTIPGQVPGGPAVTPTGTGLTKLQSGMIADLAPGEEVQFATPPQPGAEFEQFMDAFWTQIGVGLGLPREVFMKHFAASYSASRAAILEAWKTFKRRRAWLVASDCNPVWGWVISEAIARGYLQAPGFFTDPLRRAAYLGVTWRGVPMGQIDPLKEAKAAKEWLSIPGATTVQQVAAEQFGTDYEDNLDQTGRERRQIADLPPDPMAPPEPAAPNPAGNNGTTAAAVAAAVADELEARADG